MGYIKSCKKLSKLMKTQILRDIASNIFKTFYNYLSNHKKYKNLVLYHADWLLQHFIAEAMLNALAEI